MDNNPDLNKLISKAVTYAIHLIQDGALARHNYSRFLRLCDALGVEPEEMIEVAQETLDAA